MKARQRIMLTLAGQETDRVPLVPYISQFACVQSGVKYGSFCSDPRLLADTLWSCRERFGYDALYVSTDSCMEVEPMGCEVRYFEDDVPTVASHPWAGRPLSECRVEVPDPAREGRMPVYSEAIRLLNDRMKEEFAVVAGSDGPLTILGHLRGVSQFMLDLLDDQDECRRLLLEAADATIAFCLSNLRAGATLCHFGDPEVVLVGPRTYRELVQPAHMKIVESIHEEGGLVLGHFCGNTSAFMEDLVGLGCDILNIDNQMGLKEAVEYAKRVCLLGDLDPVAILRNGSEEDIESAIVDRMRLMKPTRHFMLGSGCHFPADTPPQNVESFVRHGLAHGKY